MKTVNENQIDLFYEEPVADLPQVREKRTRDIAAQKAGFSSTSTYRQAKKVVESGGGACDHDQPDGEPGGQRANPEDCTNGVIMGTEVNLCGIVLNR